MFKFKLLRGFSLVEMGIVLFIVGIFISASSVGNSLIKNAQGMRLQTDFIGGWIRAFTVYVDEIKTLPGDDPLAPTSRINKALNNRLCNATGDLSLSREFLSKVGHLISLPNGYGPDRPDQYIYQDDEGVTRGLSVCFATVNWSYASGPNQYKLTEKSVLVIKGLTLNLAKQLDAAFDDVPNARFGNFRISYLARSTQNNSSDWVLNAGDQDKFVTAYLLLR